MSSAISSLVSFDPSMLVSYYNAQLTQSSVQAGAAASSSASSSSTSSHAPTQTPPWTQTPLPTIAENAKVLSTTNFFASTTTLTPTTGASAKTEQDNNNLFTLYNAVNSLSSLASMAQNKNATAGQLAGYNTRFQTGLQQLTAFLAKTKFNNFTLQTGTPSSSVTSTVGVPLPTFGYTGGTIVTDANVGNALANVNSSESFNIAVAKGGQTTTLAIDLSQIQGPLTIDNIVSYVNQQLSNAGFSTRFQRTMTQGTINDPKTAAYGIAISDGGGETVSLSSDAATPSLYLVGDTGISAAQAAVTRPATSTSSNSSSSSASAGDQQGRLIKLSNIDGTPQGTFNDQAKPSSGLTTAQSTVVDSQGNVYVLGNATGNFGNQLNQGTQDVYLTKYDSAGNLQWTHMVGSNGSASGYSMALDPSGGGVVIAGSTTADLTQTAIANGNSDTFVASYDPRGNQNWVQQLQTLTNNQPTSVSVDSSGNVYVGGTTSTVVPVSGNTTVNGNTQGVITELDSTGKVVNSTQIGGTTGTATVAATAITSDGGLVVATVQNGEAYLSKYANGDTTSAPAWTQDLGALNAGGSIGGIAVNGNQIYVTGTTSNTNLTAGGQATIQNPATATGTNAFVLTATDNGTSVSADAISYVGNDGATSAGGITVGADGTVYLTGTTTGTFAGQSRNVTGVNNMFAASLSSSGAINWTQQYGGADGQSTGQAIAVDPQGSSVLDALGLPHGTIDTTQSVDLSNATTLRAGDSFSLKIQSAGGAASRTVKITIAPGETMDSLVTKINGELVNAGKASVTYGSAGQELKLQMNSGFTGTLTAGPANFDALARLGIQPGILTNTSSSSKKSSSTNTATGTTTSGTQVYGLGLISGLSISTSTHAGAANATLLNVLSSIRNIYQKSNAPPSTASSTPANQSTGTASPTTTAQIADYNLALNLLNSSNTSGAASSPFGTSSGSNASSSGSIASLIA
jgi:hypothetical protein